MAWTDERIELLRKSWEAGMTASQIAEVLADGVSRNAVIGKAHRLGLPPRPSPVRPGEVVLLAAGEVLVVEVVEIDVLRVEADGSVADEVEIGDPVQSPVAQRVAAAIPPVVPARRPSRSAAALRKPARTTLLDLSEKICKWPIGHPGEADFHFCGKPSQASFPYCSEHCAIAYQAQMPRRDRSRPPPPVMPGMGRR
jgi:GcrA cell cycle regulator